MDLVIFVIDALAAIVRKKDEINLSYNALGGYLKIEFEGIRIITIADDITIKYSEGEVHKTIIIGDDSSNLLHLPGRLELEEDKLKVLHAVAASVLHYLGRTCYVLGLYKAEGGEINYMDEFARIHFTNAEFEQVLALDQSVCSKLNRLLNYDALKKAEHIYEAYKAFFKKEKVANDS